MQYTYVNYLLTSSVPYPLDAGRNIILDKWKKEKFIESIDICKNIEKIFYRS